jgi:hypothetical protein
VKKRKTFAPSGNQTMILNLLIPQPSHYNERSKGNACFGILGAHNEYFHLISSLQTHAYQESKYISTFRHKPEFITEFTEFFWTSSIVLYSKKHDVLALFKGPN